MSTGVPKSAPASAPAVTGSGYLPPAVIDASARWPLMLYFAKAGFWLAAGVLFLLVASIKLHGPGFLSDQAWLGLGRVKPAAMAMLVYGFAIQTGLGLTLWMLCRLGRTPLLNAPFLYLAGVLWNLGVFLGVIGILAGAWTGFPYLEMPRVAWPFLFVALGVFALWGLLTFHSRRERVLYPSQWYLVAGLFWFTWVLLTSVYLLVFQPVRGVMQGVIYSWYAHSLFHLWLTPVAVAALYYFVPKLTGRPLYSRQLALFGFWTLAAFGGWGGLTRLAGGPLPNWMISTSIAANGLMVLPLACVVANLVLTTQGRRQPVQETLVYRFMVAGGAAYLLAGLLTIATSFRTISEVTIFTLVPMALDHLMLLGFFGLVSLGAVYYIVPRISGMEWPSPKLAGFHFAASVAGLGLYVAACLIGGWFQGTRLNNAELEFMKAYKASLPFVGMATLGLLIFLAGQIAFCINLTKVAWRWMMPVYQLLLAWMRDNAGSTRQAEVKS